MTQNDPDDRTLKDLENAVIHAAMQRKDDQIRELMSQFRLLHGFMENFRDFLAGGVQEVYFMDGYIHPHIIFMNYPSPEKWIEMYKKAKEILGEEAPDDVVRFPDNRNTANQ